MGLMKGIPQDALNRFVTLAKTLDPDLISSILEEKLQDGSWQVRKLQARSLSVLSQHLP